MKPILFSTEMVRAILDDCKTVTRRVIKYKHSVDPTKTLDDFIGTSDPQLLVSCAPYKTGDALYVRETWYYENHMHNVTAGKPDLPSGAYSHRYAYKASSPDYPVDVGAGQHGWRPSIHMPKEAARLFLRVTNVRTERLHDITAEQLRKEGLTSAAVHCGDMSIALKEWANLWNSTIKKPDLGRYGCRANPWVWAISFERIDKETAIKEE